MDDEFGGPGSAFGAPEELRSVADSPRPAEPSPIQPSPYGTRISIPKSNYSKDLPCACDVITAAATWLRPPTRRFPGDLCPEHLIRCHHSSGGATYSYADARQNAIVGADLLAERIVGHPFKHESDRLGFEKSEDALSWNVFRSLQEVGVLREVAAWLTGLVILEEPRLYLWGLRVDDDSVVPWDLLIQARELFEQNLPVKPTSHRARHRPLPSRSLSHSDRSEVHRRPVNRI